MLIETCQTNSSNGTQQTGNRSPDCAFDVEPKLIYTPPSWVPNSFRPSLDPISFKAVIDLITPDTPTCRLCINAFLHTATHTWGSSPPGKCPYCRRMKRVKHAILGLPPIPDRPPPDRPHMCRPRKPYTR